jgi:hypothetical protein
MVLLDPRNHGARRELESDDLLFEPPVGLLGQRMGRRQRRKIGEIGGARPLLRIGSRPHLLHPPHQKPNM